MALKTGGKDEALTVNTRNENVTGKREEELETFQSIGGICWYAVIYRIQEN